MTISGEKSAREIEAEAAAWAAKLDAMPDRDHPGLNEWVSCSPRHVGALLRAQAALALFEPVSARAGRTDVGTPGERRADGRVPDESAPDEGAPARDARGGGAQAGSGHAPAWKRLTFIGGGMAALVASLVAVLLLDPSGERYVTQTGEVRSVALSDGSSVLIDAGSRIDIAFDAGHRDVRMQAGKVLFRATHDARRPFRVTVAQVVITDIGTAFQVTDDDPVGDVEVLVTEGAVRVDSPAGRISLTAGQRARFPKHAMDGPRPEAVRLAPTDIERMLAWQEGRLELDGETLDSAVAEINRHNRLHLRVGSPALGRESLYGSFHMDDVTGFARAAAASLGAEARVEQDDIVIDPRKNHENR
ncbi:iron dicitrate transport regulator FecR [Gluconacetobacter sp. 1b LMG 1731]|uniref:Iron dicitrate transport regulator FecR n=1 Tax=Gluconacetobacter dulcium TaxID=2729096 RepID=A0A7W4IML9_9PROT|nr:FecR domain-containing protein [Gluconacetobacter dulcium]MBB2165638.1 iron dicitrate transport regulator FecR [Gluconacetobacter dulcium]MBB2194778.1 iron dicitrate transport regulator FecR [Gluconacetobacter dulcium]